MGLPVRSCSGIGEVVGQELFCVWLAEVSSTASVVRETLNRPIRLPQHRHNVTYTVTDKTKARLHAGFTILIFMAMLWTTPASSLPTACARPD